MNYFKDSELRCKCGCGEVYFSDETRKKLNKVREDYGKPIIISSGYRCTSYNIQIGATQTHSTGQAVDIAISRGDAFKLIGLALKHGFTGLGVKQHGHGRFLHLDDLDSNNKRVRPTVWSYK
jgi:uncharacterized protein YcbK (DUF882 family)